MVRLSTTYPKLATDTKVDLVVLKCLTVIVYLCQYGSKDFVRWLRENYRDLVVPIGRLAFSPQYMNAVYLKVSLVVKYCEDEKHLERSRKAID